MRDKYIGLTNSFHAPFQVRDTRSAAQKQRLRERFDEVDLEKAKLDVRPFVRDDAELALWSPEFFQGLVDRVVADG